MTCCDIGLLTDAAKARAGDLSAWVTRNQPGFEQIELVVPGLADPARMPEIEAAMKAVPGVHSARVNLTERRLIVSWPQGEACAIAIVEALAVGDSWSTFGGA